MDGDGGSTDLDLDISLLHHTRKYVISELTPNLCPPLASLLIPDTALSDPLRPSPTLSDPLRPSPTPPCAGKCYFRGGKLVPSSLDMYMSMEYMDQGDLFELKGQLSEPEVRNVWIKGSKIAICFEFHFCSRRQLCGPSAGCTTPLL